MKKVISIILVILMTLTVLPITAFAADEPGEIIGDLGSIESAKLDNKTPCYGEYEIVVDENQYSTMAADKKDQYESNNSFSSATKLNSQPNGEPTNFSVGISATLHRESWLWGLIKRNVDEDYYRLDIFGNSSVTISMTNIPTDCDYDLKLFKHDNTRYAESDDITQIASSVYSGSTSESISRTLSPGTYYIWVYSYNDNCSDSVYYNLSVNVNYTAQDVSISSLRYNKGAKAALWVSDYDPCGIRAYSYNSTVEVGYMNAESMTAAMKFDNPFFRYFTSGSQIDQAVLYIWDIDARNELRAFVSALYSEINSKLKKDKETLMKWEIVDSVAGNGSTAGGIIISFFEGASATVPYLEIAFTVIPIVATLAKNIFAPSDRSIIEKENFLDYLRDVRTALEANSQTGNEVVKLNYSYKYTYKNAPGIVHTNYYFDYSLTPQDSYLYSNDIIKSWNPSSVVRGTIYGICDSYDFDNAVAHGSTYLPDVNTSVIYNISLNSSVPGTLNIGEYHWFKFKATTAGTYAFYTENSGDTVGELFNSTVSARNMSGVIASNDDGGDGLNFRIEYTLAANQTVYLRIHDYNWNDALTYSLRVEKVS